mgnify:FL=1|jgi:hypothetical protein
MSNNIWGEPAGIFLVSAWVGAIAGGMFGGNIQGGFIGALVLGGIAFLIHIGVQRLARFSDCR